MFVNDLSLIIRLSLESEAERLKDSICLGLLTGQIDRTRLADHGPDVQRPKSSVSWLHECYWPLK